MNIQEELREAWAGYLTADDDADIGVTFEAFPDDDANARSFALGYLAAKRRYEGATETDEEALRDKFAGQALSGIISADGTPAPDWDRCAKNAYDLADAMLKARKGEQP